MFCGRKSKPRDLAFRLKISGSLSGASSSVVLGLTANLKTYYAPDYSTAAVGLDMTVGRTEGGAGPTQGAAVAGDVGSASWTDTGTGDVEGELKLINHRAYAMASGLWRLVYESAEWRVNGSLEATFSGATIDGTIALAPHSLPVLGSYPIVSGGPVIPRSAESAPTVGPVGTDPYSYSGSATVTTSVELYEGGVSIASWGTSFDVSCSSEGDGNGAATDEIQTKYQMVVPEWVSEIIRMEAGTGALVLRQEFPLCQTAETDVTNTYSHDIPPLPDPWPIVTGGTTYEDTLPRLSQFLGIVGDSSHVIEEPFTTTIPAIGLDGSQTVTLSLLDGKVDHTVSTEFGPYIESGHCAPYLDHAYPFLKLMATWLHPHWGFGLYSADDTDFDPDELLQRAQQHLVDATLTEDANYGRLTNVAAEPLDQNGLTGLCQETIGCPSWWGIDGAGILTIRIVLPTSLPLDDRTDGRWTFAGDGSSGSTGTGSVTGGSIRGDAGNTTFDFPLGDYNIWPRQTSHFSDRLRMTLSGATNVSRIEAFLIGADGKAVKIGEDTDSQPMDLPRGRNSKWWTSAGEAFVSDTYVQVAPAGADASPAVALSAELATAMPFVGFGAGMRIRFVATPIDPGEGVSFAYPALYSGSLPADGDAVRPDAAALVLLQTNGPAVRYGVEDHYDVATDDIVPEGLPWPVFDRKRELGDGYVWLNLWTLAKAYDDGLHTWLQDNFEEGVEWTQDKHAWRDPFEQARVTHSFIVQGANGPVMVLVQSYRAAPPIGYAPNRELRREDDWAPTGALGMRSYTLCQMRQWHATTEGDGKGLYHPTDELTYPATQVDGWRAGYHTLAVDATEDYDWEIHSPPVLAKVKPYRGYVWDGWAGLQIGGWIAQSRRGHLHIATIMSGDVYYERAKTTTIEAGFHDQNSVTSFGDVVAARMVIDEARGKIVLAVTREDNSLYVLESHSDGADFDGGSLVATNAFGGLTWTEPSGATGVTWFEYDSGTSGPGVQKAQYKPYLSNTFGSTFTFQRETSPGSGTYEDIPVADGGWSNVVLAFDGQRRLTWSPIIDGESTYSNWYSTDDGETWTRVT